MIWEAFRDAKAITFLLELDFAGVIKRYSHRNITVPSSGDDLLFEGRILNTFYIGSQYNQSSGAYSLGSLAVQIANVDRLQDIVLQYPTATGKIWIWCDGLTWEEIETDGLIFYGTFETDVYDYARYNFNLVDPLLSLASNMPKDKITTTTWPLARAASINKYEPIVFGNFPFGIPLIPINDTAFIYLAAVGRMYSEDADYAAGTVDVYTAAGAVVDPADYVFSHGIDATGNPCALFDFSASPAASEPLSCSIQGAVDRFDSPGDNGFSENPAEIIYQILCNNFESELNIEMFRTFKTFLAEIKFSVYANSPVSIIDLAQRILSPLGAGLLWRKGKLGPILLNPNIPAILKLNTDTNSVNRISITATQAVKTVNKLTVSYGLNITTGQYTTTFVLDELNNDTCKLSNWKYGDLPEQFLNLADVQYGQTARFCAKKFLDMYAFRHNIANVEVPYWVGLQVVEGDAVELTAPEGSSIDGLGWIDEKFLVLERIFGPKTIKLTLWRVAV